MASREAYRSQTQFVNRFSEGEYKATRLHPLVRRDGFREVGWLTGGGLYSGTKESTGML
jgi:hypothetical protein